MNYQKLILVGNVTRDAQRRKSQKGDVSYTTFNVGVGDAKGRSTFFPITVFGKYAESVTQHLTKGRQVLVEGRIEQSTQGRMTVVADQVRFGAQAEPAKPATQDKPAEEE